MAQSVRILYGLCWAGETSQRRGHSGLALKDGGPVHRWEENVGHFRTEVQCEQRDKRQNVNVGLGEDVGDCLGGRRTVPPVSLPGGAQEPEDLLPQTVLALRHQEGGGGRSKLSGHSQ